ncbi:hypothetical protein Vretimale_12677 [Volvox reticuliferus]|uniref:Major facilitator superfamily (MFS) profile domain-containing protein n=1 Tax=Volvox reticuliferus TaxID=1737510 RepID=A0A8J4BUP9_9CHLO|nr:hypothetical protein Vretifemale_140 [Volvox reticuliferus]GIM08675.1 hypothetical protein Vretimale_12677 [Volvox reticuliferus]
MTITVVEPLGQGPLQAFAYRPLPALPRGAITSALARRISTASLPHVYQGPGLARSVNGRSLLLQRSRTTHGVVVAAASAGAPTEGNGRGDSAAAATSTTAPPSSGPVGRFLSIFNVFSDERCNSKLLALAIGQMLCSIATLIHDSYLPIYVHEELGLSTTKIGAVQGAAQFLCQISKGVSGVVGDILGSQTRVLVFGTFLTLACKPMFALLSTVYGIFGVTACLYWFFMAKLFDRLSKGIREAPTKAVMNELAKDSGDAPDAAYGLRQSLATAGMLIGSTIASLTFAATGNNYILTFTVAAIPPALALLWLVANFREELFGASKETAAATVPIAASTTTTPPPPQLPAAASSFDGVPSPPSATSSLDSPPPSPTASVSVMSVSVDIPVDKTIDSPQPALTSVAVATPAEAVSEPVLSPLEKAIAILKAFRPVYWQALIVVAVLYFARFDASFLSIRAKAVMPKTLLPMMTLVNTLIQMLLTAPLARISGASVRNRNRLLLVGFGFMVLADTCFALPLTANPAGMFIGSAFIGLHMAMTHAITISMISSYMPTGKLPGVGKLSGTAVSFTDLLLGFVLAASNAVAGVLTDVTRSSGLGNVGCFMGGAAACVLSGVLLVLFERFGDLGRDDLVVKKSKKKAPTTPTVSVPTVVARPASVAVDPPGKAKEE